MTWDKIVVDLLGLASIAFIVWFFWLVKAKGTKPAVTSVGYQEQMVLVKGGYTPDVIVVERGKPVRLNFVRQESASCSEMVLLPRSTSPRSSPRARRCRSSSLQRRPASTSSPADGHVRRKGDRRAMIEAG